MAATGHACQLIGVALFTASFIELCMIDRDGRLVGNRLNHFPLRRGECIGLFFVYVEDSHQAAFDKGGDHPGPQSTPEVI